MHYALRPWPWILVALASLVLYPDLASLQTAFPNVEESKLGHDLAYSAMLTKLPSGLLGLVLASLGAAYMSTISTHLNWGSSYIVNDFYKQQINRNASEKQLVNVGRLSTIFLMAFSALFALFLTNALQLFDIILMFGAGTGLIFILRWFWWRINAWSEISAMFASGLISILLNFTSLSTLLFDHQTNNEIFVEGIFPAWSKFPIVVLITSIVWVTVTFLTKPETDETLRRFYKKTTPGGPGWARILNTFPDTSFIENENKKKWTVPSGILAMILGCFMVYGAMFATGNFLYGNYKLASGLLLLVIFSVFLLIKLWKNNKISTR